jgi:hypothetical protein
MEIAGRIRQGYCPHPRHWQALAKLVSVSGWKKIKKTLWILMFGPESGFESKLNQQ